MSDNYRAAHAITLLNPWAHLIAHRGKNIENRGWMPHEGVDRLLIHAGKAWDTFSPRGRTLEPEDLERLTPSAIVAVADLAFACPASRYSAELRCGCGDWAAPNHCHWNLINVRTLPTPVPCRGRQGLWKPDLPILHAVAAQLRAVNDRA